jgi:hypothetical protein
MRQSSKGRRLTVGVLTAFFASAPVASEATVSAATDGALAPENKSFAMSPSPVGAPVSVSPAALEKIKLEAEGVGAAQSTIHEARSQVTPVRRRSSQVTPLSPRSSQVTPFKKPSDLIVK